MKETFGILPGQTTSAIQAADEAQESFHKELTTAARAILDEVERKGTYAVVLASRPYQNDALVNHDLPAMFTRLGIPVLTVDSLPGLEKVDLSRSRCV